MIIGLHAKKRSGKDTLAAMICENLGYSQVAFAEPLYRGLKAMFPFIPAECWENRNLIMPCLGKSVNEMLQSLGTEWGRENVLGDVWVRVADAKAKERLREASKPRGIVFSDVRYANEAEYIVKEKGGLIIEIQSSRGVTINEHSSESRIPDKYIHTCLYNDSTKEDLWNSFISLPFDF